jgi:hypothetical protein
VDCYVDAQRCFPLKDIPLETAEKTAYFQKMEVHKGIYWYTTDPGSNTNPVAVPVERVREIQVMNRKGIKPEHLLDNGKSWESAAPSADLLEDSTLTRFDPAHSGKQHRHLSRKKKNRRFNDKRNR